MASVVPPQWLLSAANVITLASCVLLFMYLLGRLECNKFVRLTIALQLAFVTMALVAWGGPY